MSKWIDKELFNEFAKEKKKEAEQQEEGFSGISKWPTPPKGSAENPKVYELRFLPDMKQGFYKKFYYHMFQPAGSEKWQFTLCPKTFNFENPCPICSVVNKLFKGTEDDKKEAKRLKRKPKYASNVYIVNDPRDTDKDPEEKFEGKVLLYEFPGKVEQKLKEEIRDSRNGLGMSIFDPGGDGYNFILKVGEQKGGGDQSFPEYSMSMFARKPCPIAESEAEIDKLMEQRVSIDEYFQKMKKDQETLIGLMENEMYYDLISSEFPKEKKKSPKKEEKPEQEESKPEPESKPESEPEKEQDSSSDDDLTDEDLLKELQNLG